MGVNLVSVLFKKVCWGWCWLERTIAWSRLGDFDLITDIACTSDRGLIFIVQTNQPAMQWKISSASGIDIIYTTTTTKVHLLLLLTVFLGAALLAAAFLQHKMLDYIKTGQNVAHTRQQQSTHSLVLLGSCLHLGSGAELVRRVVIHSLFMTAFYGVARCGETPKVNV